MQPKVFSIDHHLIPPEKIDKHAYYVVQKLRQKGYAAYLVGGSVRDLLLGKKPKDFDISTSARPEEVKKVFRNCLLIGKRFRLAHIRFGKKVIEVSTFRSGDIENSTLIVRDNDFGTEEEDVLRRDFTINGLLYDPEKETVIDYVGGYPDIEKKILRTIGRPEIRFKQDPVRMIRLLKFHARFHLTIDSETHKALTHCKEDITKSSQARIFEELLRMLESGASEPFFKTLAEYGFLKLLIPELHKYKGKQKIYQILKQIDKEIEINDLERPLLVSCLIYPAFQDFIENRGEKIHLGVIAEFAHEMILNFFKPFFQIPRKMRGIMTFILTSQYRFVPLKPSSAQKIRIPRDSDFPQALRFFKLRMSLEPSLEDLYIKWKEAYGKPKKYKRTSRKKIC